MVPCPHCRATSAAERSASLRWRCAVCGGPIVPSDGSFRRAGGELASLVGAARSNGMALGWTAAAGVLGVAAMATLLLGLLLWHAAHLAGVLLAVVAGVALALAIGSALRARARRSEARVKLDEAWSTVAGEIVAARGGDVTAANVAKALSIDEGYAQTLLSELSAEGRVRVAVRDDAQLSYTPGPTVEAETSDSSGPSGAPGARRET